MLIYVLELINYDNSMFKGFKELILKWFLGKGLKFRWKRPELAKLQYPETQTTGNPDYVPQRQDSRTFGWLDTPDLDARSPRHVMVNFCFVVLYLIDHNFSCRHYTWVIFFAGNFRLSTFILKITEFLNEHQKR